MARAPYPVKSSLRELPKEVADQTIRVAFHLPPEVEWRWPEPGERIYHRPADGFISVWLEHLRSRWNPRWHLFFKHLCKYEFQCSPMQITPNGIKWMTWFILVCNKMNYQPTLKLFHLLFNSRSPGRSHWQDCGFGPRFLKPMIH